MTVAPPKKQIKRQPTCPHCKTRFRTTSTTAVYCDRSCKDKAAAIKKRVKYVDKAADSAFFKQLAFEASRAGTLEVFTGLDAESLTELYKLYAFKLRANKFGDSKDYELSHISPSQGHASVGLFHPRNIVVAPKPMNRAHGTQHFGHGLSIDRKRLKSRHMVEKGASQKDTVARIIQFIGPDVVAEAAKLAGIKPSARNTTLAWLREHLDPHNPQHRDWLGSLDTLHTRTLKAIRAELEGKETGGFVIKTRTFTPFEVLYQELARHTRFRPELIEVQEAIHEAVTSYLANWPADMFCDRSTVELIKYMPADFMSGLELQALFDVLHGKGIDDIRPVLESFTERHSGAVERIPPYRPIVFKHRAKAPVTQQPIARSFADELDAVEVLDAIPVLLPGHTATYESDSLPWLTPYTLAK